MSKEPHFERKTIAAVILSSFAHEPFIALYTLLPFILINNFKASAFQIVLLTMLKPMSTIFSFYWSFLISQKKYSLKMNLLCGGLLARVPFIFAIFLDSSSALIVASTLYMLFTRATTPAWIEILKLNLHKRKRERYFSIASALGYAEGVLITICIGSLLDSNVGLWRVLYLTSLLISILGLFIQVSIPIYTTEAPNKVKKINSFKENLTGPFLDFILLMKSRSDFRRFQLAFMTGGFGLMIIQPVIPIFFAKTLNISYKDLMIAFCVCKGLGFVFTSTFWSRSMHFLTIGKFMSLVFIGFSAFSIFVICGIYNHVWIYIAYFVYGVAQAGSHLIWHLSGPIFADNEDSSRFSGVNIITVGIRGIVGPPIGAILAASFGPVSTIGASAIICLCATLVMFIKMPARLNQPA